MFINIQHKVPFVAFHTVTLEKGKANTQNTASQQENAMSGSSSSEVQNKW